MPVSYVVSTYTAGLELMYWETPHRKLQPPVHERPLGLGLLCRGLGYWRGFGALAASFRPGLLLVIRQLWHVAPAGILYMGSLMELNNTYQLAVRYVNAWQSCSGTPDPRTRGSSDVAAGFLHSRLSSRGPHRCCLGASDGQIGGDCRFLSHSSVAPCHF